MAKPLVVILCLEDYSLELSFKIHRHLLSTLPNRAEVRQALKPSQARRYLTSTIRPHAVIVVDSALAHSWYRDILWLLGSYVKAGGTAIFSGMFISTIPDMSFDEIWRDVFLLRWRACFPDRGSKCVLNSHVDGLDVAELPSGYKPSSGNATWINGVSPEHGVYMDSGEIKKLEKGKEAETSRQAMVKTPIAFATHKKGRIGYVGDMNIQGSKHAAQVILAMCFYPGSQAPIASGTGGPPISMDPGPTSTDECLPRRNILILSLQKPEWTDDMYAQLYNALRINANVTEVQSSGAAFTALATPQPDVVLVSDGAITGPQHSRVLSKLVEYARAGGVVILGMHFSNFFPLSAGRSFFGQWGLPWDLGSYHRTTFAVNPDGVPTPLDKHTLVPAFSMKALHIKGAAREHAVYLPTAESRLQSLVWAPQPITGELAQESPAVFARVGEGHLGYVGDANGEQGSTRIIIEMCGVKIQPGDLGSRRLPNSFRMRPNGTAEAVGTEEEVLLPVPPRPPPLPRAPRARDEEVRAWDHMREMDRKERIEEAEEDKAEGNDLFRVGKWQEAAEKYRSAIICRGPQPVYLANLAAALLKLELYEIADSAASRALMHDPKHIKALYRRALARNALGRSNAAMYDITRLLALEPTNRPARDELGTMVRFERAVRDVNWPGDGELFLKEPTDIELPLEIDDSDCDPFKALTVGNGEVCRAWNHDGCEDGDHCSFKHAPDGQSVRDDLRRNVCLSWLLGECRFGDNCLYAHDKEYLPPQGWWTNDARLSQLRQEFQIAVKEAPLDFADGPVSECILAEALKPLHWQFDLWFTVEYDHDADDRMYNEPPRALDDESEWMEEERMEEGDFGPEALEEELSERANDYGYTEADGVEEMLMYGIKPYDPDAYDELTQIQLITGSGGRR
ncbi:hypothetical protein LXA43DRAFT_1185370 [Ganoderma leucocontextum]|nr:hypothetical protein LXA43DRAFT_1185370 [Ganoderma leucocontextum]